MIEEPGDPAARSSADFGSVADDMHAIFGTAGHAPISGRQSAVRKIRRTPRQNTKPIRHVLVAVFGGLLAIALVGAFYKHLSKTTPVQPQTAKPGSSSEIMQSQEQRPPADAPSVAVPVKEHPGSALDIREAPQLPRPRNIVAGPHTPPQGSDAIRRVQVSDRQDAQKPKGVARCSGLATQASRAWCLRPALLDEDAMLRDAYAAARKAGVDSSILERYQHRWAKANYRSVNNSESALKSLRVIREELIELSNDKLEEARK